MDILECFDFTEGLMAGLNLNMELFAELFYECQYVNILLDYCNKCVTIKIPSFMDKIWTPPGTVAVGMDCEYIMAYNGFVRRYKSNKHNIDMYLMYNPEAKTREYYGFIAGRQSVWGKDNIIRSVIDNEIHTPFGYITKVDNAVRLANNRAWFYWPIYRKIEGVDMYGNKVDTTAFCNGCILVNNWIPRNGDEWFKVEKSSREEILTDYGEDLEMELIPAPPARTDVVMNYASNVHQIIEKYFTNITY